MTHSTFRIGMISIGMIFLSACSTVNNSTPPPISSSSSSSLPSVASSTPYACTMDVLQCPDGSFVGRTGPNCMFVCPMSSSEQKAVGTVEGSMTISPACPVMKEGNPCLTTPEMYAARPVTVYDATKAKVVATLIPDENGKFSAKLAEGTYIVDVEHQAVGSVTGAPATVVIRANQTVTITIDIDSGIR